MWSQILWGVNKDFPIFYTTFSKVTPHNYCYECRWHFTYRRRLTIASVLHLLPNVEFHLELNPHMHFQWLCVSFHYLLSRISYVKLHIKFMPVHGHGRFSFKTIGSAPCLANQKTLSIKRRLRLFLETRT